VLPIPDQHRIIEVMLRSIRGDGCEVGAWAMDPSGGRQSLPERMAMNWRAQAMIPACKVMQALDAFQCNGSDFA